MNRICRCDDGSEVIEKPSRQDILSASGPPYTIDSPTWTVYGDPGCQAAALADELAEQWGRTMERLKADMSARLKAMR